MAHSCSFNKLYHCGFVVSDWFVNQCLCVCFEFYQTTNLMQKCSGKNTITVLIVCVAISAQIHFVSAKTNAMFWEKFFRAHTITVLCWISFRCTEVNPRRPTWTPAVLLNWARDLEGKSRCICSLFLYWRVIATQAVHWFTVCRFPALEAKLSLRCWWRVS